MQRARSRGSRAGRWARGRRRGGAGERDSARRRGAAIASVELNGRRRGAVLRGRPRAEAARRRETERRKRASIYIEREQRERPQRGRGVRPPPFPPPARAARDGAGGRIGNQLGS